MANQVSIEAVHNQVYSGFEVLTAQEWCTPSIIGCSGCISADAQDGNVILTITLRTPFGNITKSFTINRNISFTWQPFDRVKITIAISNFTNNGQICFDLGGELCIKLIIVGWKCIGLSHKFCLPTHAVTNTALTSGTLDNLSDAEFASHLALFLLAEEGHKCNCSKG